MPKPSKTQPEAPKPEYLSIVEACAKHKVSKKTLHRRAAEGVLQKFSKKNLTYFLVSELDAAFPEDPVPVE